MHSWNIYLSSFLPLCLSSSSLPLHQTLPCLCVDSLGVNCHRGRYLLTLKNIAVELSLSLSLFHSCDFIFLLSGSSHESSSQHTNTWLSWLFFFFFPLLCPSSSHVSCLLLRAATFVMRASETYSPLVFFSHSFFIQCLVISIEWISNHQAHAPCTCVNLFATIHRWLSQDSLSLLTSRIIKESEREKERNHFSWCRTISIICFLTFLSALLME